MLQNQKTIKKGEYVGKVTNIKIKHEKRKNRNGNNYRIISICTCSNHVYAI